MARSQDGLTEHIEHLGLPVPIVEAFRAVDRAGYVEEDSRHLAYEDRPLPIGEGQTTSQPSLIAMMIAAAEVSPGSNVLEIGTGNGFQTALLAHLAHSVVSIERWESLAYQAKANLERNQVANASVFVGDGYEGWPPGAPYDAIVVSAVAPEVPVALDDQLAEGGRLVIPVASPYSDDVVLYRKVNGVLERSKLVSPARFVPLVREERPE